MLTFVCALLMAQGAWAQDAAVVGHVKIGDLYYNLDMQNHTAQVTYDPTDSGEKYKGLTAVSIPASVSYEEQEFSVTEIGVRAFAYCMTDLTTVSIAEGVTCIGDSVFYGCEQLAGMVIPNSVSTIGNSIESLHIYSHAIITADYERPSTNEGFSKEQALLLLFPNREFGNLTVDHPEGWYTINGRRLSVKPTQKGVYINKGMKVVVR